MSVTNNLATKYRPRKLSDLVGQDTATTLIKGFIKSKKIPPVILLSGETGSGKTTTARMICNLINGIAEDDNSESRDILEHNCGTDGGKDDMIDLIRKARFAPTANYRCIIVDEIHRLSTAGASALLKPLEDSPKSTVWIFCTDQPEKLLPSIRGRAFKIDLRTPSPPQLVPMLQRVCKREKITFYKDDKKQDDLLLQIGIAANGQPREALQVLARVITAFEGGDNAQDAIKEAVKQLLNVGNDLIAVKILIGIYIKKPKLVIKALNDVVNKDYIGLTNLLMYSNQYLLNLSCGVNEYMFETRRILVEKLKSNNSGNLPELIEIVKIHDRIVDMKRDMGTFMVNEQQLCLAKLTKLAF